MQAEDNTKYQYLDEFKIINNDLGSGLNSTVKLGEYKGQRIAIKQYKNDPDDLQTFNNEKNVFQNLDYQHIIKKIDVRPHAIYKNLDSTSYQCSAIILEYARGGDFFDIINYTEPFSERFARACFLQIIKGLHYLHTIKRYTHKDIKNQNILINKDNILKLADFGFSESLKGKNSRSLHKNQGTQGYKAPQIYRHEYDGVKVDIFAAGVSLFIMCAKDIPFTSPSQWRYGLISEKNYTKYWIDNPGENLSDDFKNLFLRMVAQDPQQRPTTQQILSDPWLRQQMSLDEVKNQLQRRINIKELIVKQLIMQQNQQKLENIKSLNSNGSNRGQIINADQFSDLYEEEISKKRKLKNIKHSSPEDFIIKQQLVYSLCLFRNFLNKKIVPMNNNSFFNLEKNQAIQDGFILKYSLIQKKIKNHKSSSCIIELKIQFSEPKDSKISVIITHISGNGFYFKKIAIEIKNLYRYCLA